MEQSTKRFSTLLRCSIRQSACVFALLLSSVYSVAQTAQSCTGTSCETSDSKAIKFDPFNVFAADRLPLKNTERLDTGLPVTRASICQIKKACYRTTKKAKDRRVAVDNAIEAVRFASGKHYISEAYIEKLKALLESFKDKQDVRLQFIGHTDNERLSLNAKRLYLDNLGLSRYRAKAVMLHMQQALGLTDSSVDFEGRAFNEPIASNDTHQGMALNRRVEIVVSHSLDTGFDEHSLPMEQCPISYSPDVKVLSQQYKLLKPAEVKPWRISIDGRPMQLNDGLHIADIQRCNDVGLEKAKVQIQFDSGKADPALNVAAWPITVSKGAQVDFKAWTNYPYWIERYEVRIYKPVSKFDKTMQPDNSVGEVLFDTLLLNSQLHSTWQVPKDLNSSHLNYRLRVYDKDGRFDETSSKPLVLITAASSGNASTENNSVGNNSAEKINNHAVSNEWLMAYGKSTLAKQNIPVRGGTVTVNGIDVPNKYSVWVLDQEVPVDENGSFVTQHILPHGFHTASVALQDGAGNGERFWRDLRVENNDWFYVGIADLTLAESDHSGNIDLVRNDALYDSSSYGRFAFYAKGNINPRYRLTARVDTGEEPLNRVFKNIDQRDPRSLLRRIDSEDGLTTFADDSATVDDTPTQGKFYLKVEDDRSHIMWGNQAISIDDNELAQIHRGLYGLSAAYQSKNTADNGEALTNIEWFAASPDTVTAHEEFRSTGGSLYYLQHRDLTLGSEQIRVETRDKNTGFVIASRPLKLGQDYDIDELQGTVLLTHPLASYATGLNAGSLVRTASYDGQPAYLVVNYEYQPALADVDVINIGGRASQWLGDVLQLGVTANHQANDLADDQTVAAADITLHASTHTWVKYSQGYSKGPGVKEQISLDGGFDFVAGNSVQTNTESDASRVEFKLDGKDIGIDKTFITTAYWQDREAGYSSLAQQALDNTEQLGVNTQLAIRKDLTLAASHTENDIDNSAKNKASEIDLHFDLSKHWRVSAGARKDQQHAVNTAKQDRLDGLLRFAYQSESSWQAYVFGQDTFESDEGRRNNNRYGVGGKWNLNKHVSTHFEYSEGELGSGALLGLNYQPSANSSYYLNYSLDADEEIRGISNSVTQNASSTGDVVVGTKTRFNDSVSVYAEEHFAYGDQAEGLTQAYGVELAFDERWTYGANVEHGKLDTELNGEIKRWVAGLQLGYSHNDIRYAGALEYRNDESATQERDSWLLRNTLKYQIDEDWRFISRFDYAFSHSSEGDFFDGDYIEGVLGYGYRPVDNSRWNNLVSYTFLFDKTSSDQLNRAEQSIDYQQRSHVLAVDLNYDISKRWELGGRYAYRKTELRDRALNSGDWFESDAALYVLRADYHLTHHWDFLAEARLLDLQDADEQLSGALVGLYRHFGNHFKLGVGYNFSEFTDDLTDLDYDAKGFFINLIGKI